MSKQRLPQLVMAILLAVMLPLEPAACACLGGAGHAVRLVAAKPACPSGCCAARAAAHGGGSRPAGHAKSCCTHPGMATAAQPMLPVLAGADAAAPPLAIVAVFAGPAPVSAAAPAAPAVPADAGPPLPPDPGAHGLRAPPARA